MMRKAALAAIAFAALAGCARGTPAPRVGLHVTGIEGGCRFEAEGRVLATGSLSAAEMMLAEATRRWRGRPVMLLAGTEAPYKCVGLAVYILQRAGAHVGFIAEPPPEAR
jgi:hypothetical protein